MRGVVTFAVEGQRRIYVQEEEAGLLVTYTNAFLASASQMVEVEGMAGPGLLAPMLTDTHVRLLGTAPLPAPRRIATARLAAGELVGHWVAVEGVVRDVAWNMNRRILFISSGGLRFHAVMQPCPDTTLPTDWLDARVELRGVCLTDVDRENKPMGFTLYTPDTNQVTFLHPGAATHSANASPRRSHVLNCAASPTIA